LHWIIDGVWIERFCDDASSRCRHAIEAIEQTSRSCTGTEHPEVLAEHDYRVELSEGGIDSVDPQDACVANTSPLAGSDRSGRGVDADYFETAFLKMKARPATAAADIEHAPAYEAHRATLIGVIPPLERREKVGSVENHHEAVVTLGDLPCRLPGKRVLENSAPDIANARLSHPQIPSISP
jgi:hypothetical protein